MPNPQDTPIDVARRVLAELAELAEHASLTRGLRGGEKSAAQAYNRVLATFIATERFPEGMFEPIEPETADFGQLGVQCRLLSAAMGAKAEAHPGESLGSIVGLAPFLDAKDLAELVRERIDGDVRVPESMLTALAPFLDSETLGSLIRRRPRPPVPPQPPTAPAHTSAPRTPAPPAEPTITDRTLAFVDAPPENLETLASELRRPDLTPAERQRIATRLAELAYEHSTHALEG